MSIIQTVRDKYLWVVSVAIALSVIGFLLMDARSGSARGGGPNQMEEKIGSVNGQTFTYGQFMDMEKNIESSYAQQGQPVTDATRQQIYQQTWSQLTNMAVIDQEVSKLGFALTEKEINDEMFVSNPPDVLKQQFTNKETNQFDAVAARNALNTIKKSKNEVQKQAVGKIIDDYVENLLRKKYFALWQASSYVPKWMAEKEMADKNTIASFQYVAVPYSSISDSTIKISDDQINAYIKDHASQYKQEEATRSIAYVAFEVKPTAADSAATYKEIADLKSGFANTKDPGAFIDMNKSSMTYFNGYNSKAKLMMPEKDSILAAGTGVVYGPYMDGNAWVLSKIIDVKELPDSAKARHILIGTMDAQTQQPTLDDATAKARIDSIYTAIKGGASFDMMVLQYSDDQGSKMKGGVYDFFEQGKMVPEFNDSVFQGKVGDYKIVRTQFGYHLINILGQKGMSPNYKIAYMAKNIVPSSQTNDDIVAKANAFAGNSRSLKDFDENIKKSNYMRLISQDIKGTDFSIPGVGEGRSLVRWIYDNKVGDVSDPQDMKDKYVVLAITGAEDAGLQSAAKARPYIEPILRNAEKAKQIIKNIGTVTTLEALAAAQKQTVQRADSVSFASATIPMAGPELKVVGAAFNKANLNKVSQPIEGNSGVYAIKSEMIGAKPAVGPTVEEERKQMEDQAKRMNFNSTLAGLLKAANLKDNRSKLL